MRRALFAPVFAAAVVAGAGCTSKDVTFYEVTRSRTAECAIRSNGEFCVEPEQFAPPETSVWTVEFDEDASRLFVDEEVWVLEPIEEGANPLEVQHTATRHSVITSGNGPCTSTTDETLTFTADGTIFSGALRRENVLTGPAACGDTPVGERSEDDLAGSAFTADGFQVGP